MIASQVLGNSSRYTIVVDDDINPSNLSEVMWAVATRTDERSIQILPDCPSNSTNTMIPPAEKRKWKVPPKPLTSARIVIDACRPFQWKDEFYPVARVSPDYRIEILGKWESLFKELL
ncbi:hypothetical protein ACFLTZ_06030 [Chloroflexota bacterium]